MPSCTTAATTVVRGVSSSARAGVAHDLVVRRQHAARQEVGHHRQPRARWRWNWLENVCSAICAATSPSGWPPMPSASTNSPASRV
jgi:hypothetical protein